MFIELVDSLRCIRPHEITWLVASADTMRRRDIVRGILGCPVCRAEYPIVNGVARFGDSGPDIPAAVGPPPSDDATLRIAALLDVSLPGGFVTLTGSWARFARPLSVLAEGVHVLALNPDSGLDSGEGVSVATAADEVPLRPNVCRGIVVDSRHSGLAWLASAAAALLPGGRLVAPVGVPGPGGLRELARDDRLWVATKEPEPTPVRFHLARRSP